MRVGGLLKRSNHSARGARLSDSFRVAIDSFWLLLSNGLSMVLTFLFWIFVSRSVAPSLVGELGSFLSLSIFLSSLGTLGLQTGTIRFLHQFPSKKSAIRIFHVMGLSASVGASVLGFITVSLIGSPSSIGFSGVLSAFEFIVVTGFATLSVLIDSASLSIGKSSMIAARSTICGATRLLLILILGPSQQMILISWIVGSMVSVIIGYLTISFRQPVEIIPVERSRDGQLIREVISFSLISAVGSFFWGLPQGLMPYFASSILSPESAAFFYVATTIASIPIMVIQGVSMSSLRHVSQSERVRPRFFRNLLIAELIVSFASILGVLIFGERLLTLFGVTYSIESFVPLIILVSSYPLLCVISVVATFFMMTKEVRKVNLIYIPSSISILLAGLLIMGHFGVPGISLAYLIGYGVGFGVAAGLYRARRKAVFNAE